MDEVVMQFESVIGLEVHAQLLTRSKIFCACSTEFGAPPNTHTCPVCLGMPGVLPVLNQKVVEYSIRVALATHCAIARESRFARKNYFYPDLPKGYQISQFELPIAEHGHIEIEVNKTRKRIGITRIHMEEDAGKLQHDPYRPISLVDFNRTGVPLIEIVSEPDLRSPEEAGEYLRHLRSVLVYLGVCDGNMEEGSFRCDANVSIRPEGSRVLGTRTELKNMNSFRNVEKALAYEIRRQTERIEEGHRVIQETLLWDPDKGVSHPMRGKEEAHDYRYFTDPDLVPLIIDDEWVATVKKGLPELPQVKKQRFMTDYDLPAYDADVLATSRELGDYFEACVRRFPRPKQVSNWIMGPLFSLLRAEEKEITQSPISPERLAGLLQLIDSGTISGKIAKRVFEDMAKTGGTAKEIVKKNGLVQVTDTGEIEDVVRLILSKLPGELEAYRNGKQKLFGFFVGQIMKETKGKANPEIVNRILKKHLSAEPS
ncbi:MAG: Asp-tRNA(Asn)/Glu-tRNA(Gln) amidotransferase subunit GatB [Desulfobacteria bacterium]